MLAPLFLVCAEMLPVDFEQVWPLDIVYYLFNAFELIVYICVRTDIRVAYE